MSCITILVFGTNCAGKSTFSKALAGKLTACAHIEVDVLRYMVMGGLVACSAGRSPAVFPDEYRRQCWLGVENALLLARHFNANGFSAVIEGLEDECAPGGTWASSQLRGLSVINVLLKCDRATLRSRWQERTGNAALPDGVIRSATYGEQRESSFQLVLDSSATGPEVLATRACEFLRNER